MSKRVVIIGGGPSAKHAAELLAKSKDLKVTVVQANKFVEWPLAMTCAMVKADLHDEALATNCETFQVPGVEYRYSVARSVDPANRRVVVANGETLPYDALVVATGVTMPLVYPSLGTSVEDRKEEIRRVAACIRDARCVVVAGGGPVGLEIAGDIRAEYEDKRVVLLTRHKVLSQWPERRSAKVESRLEAMRIEVVSSTSDAPKEPSLQQGTLQVNGETLAYDCYLPAFSQGPNTEFLKGNPSMLDSKGYIDVNEYLQSVGHKEIFGIGVTNFREPFIGFPKLQGEWESVTRNVQAMLAGKPMKPHKEGMPFMKLPPALLIGHGPKGYGYLDFSNVPPPLKCCCCCGLGGFPFCPPPCCWPCCGACPYGYCCGPSEGSGFSTLMGKVAFKSAGWHFEGVGEWVPQQQRM